MVLCPLCTNVKRTLNDASSLSRHVQYVHFNHNNDKEFQCIVSDCNTIIKGPTNILQHFKIHHKDEPGFEFLQKKIKPNDHQKFESLNNEDFLDCDDFELNEISLKEINDFHEDVAIEKSDFTNNEILLFKLNYKKSSSQEDKFCDLVVNQKRLNNLTEKGTLDIACEWLNFISDGLKSGNNIFKVKIQF